MRTQKPPKRRGYFSSFSKAEKAGEMLAPAFLEDYKNLRGTPQTTRPVRGFPAQGAGNSSS